MNNPIGVAVQFLRRSHTERTLLIGTSVLFICAHALLRRHQLEQVRTRMQRLAAQLHAHAQDVHQLAWAIDRVNHRLPGTHSCLVHALACDAIAHASGLATEFHIGAARANHRHCFHAWVEHQGHILTGEEHAGFARLV